ncbi:hypothetical protein [Jiangella gansuensis]|uniref:hypothetical protein n=1 Tax=Jiangella gansuensis TaxID=281473 RepID=UPI00047A4BEC|nr:hypothetical protein [Jiangella gansuensis]
MIESWRLFLAARPARAALVVGVLVAAVSLAGRSVFIEVRLVWAEPPRWTMLWEALPAVYGALIGGFIAPRLHSWGRTGTAPMRRYYAITVTVALALPAVGPWLVHFTFPSEAPWLDIMVNVVMITAIGLLATCLLGTIGGPIVAVSAYLAVVLIQQAAPGVAPWLPFSDAVGEPEPHIWQSLTVAVLAIAAWTITLGRSPLARALERNDAAT